MWYMASRCVMWSSLLAICVYTPSRDRCGSSSQPRHLNTMGAFREAERALLLLPNATCVITALAWTGSICTAWRTGAPCPQLEWLERCPRHSENPQTVWVSKRSEWSWISSEVLSESSHRQGGGDWQINCKKTVSFNRMRLESELFCCATELNLYPHTLKNCLHLRVFCSQSPALIMYITGAKNKDRGPDLALGIDLCASWKQNWCIGFMFHVEIPKLQIFFTFINIAIANIFCYHTINVIIFELTVFTGL